MNTVRNPSTFSPENHSSTAERGTDFRHQHPIMDCQGPSFEQDILDTISELPEHCENTGSVVIKTDHEEDTPPLNLHESEDTESDSLGTKSVSTSQQNCCEMPLPKCNEEGSNSTKSIPATTLQSLSSSTSPSPCHHLKSDQEDALSADEGIQTSPPFERDDSWDHQEDLDGETPTTTRRRRYSMSSAMVHRPRRLANGDGEEDVILRSPNKSWLADELKSRRSRYRPKSCSLPHVEWLKQRTETALDRSAEMQRRTAELLRSAKAIREQDV
ncbi:uncharacterized protein [Asterias amurensis]|uniref:uncharacterized protein n=1 Tax=Asterias amurensis TaxID=7602 RepID=UPI003AB90AC8